MNNGVKKFRSLWSKFDERVGLARIELHYKFGIWHNLQRSWNIEHFLYREHEIQKGGPQIMTSWYDDVVPGMLLIAGDGGDDACSTCHVHACVNTHMVPSSAAQTWYEGAKSDGHTLLQFCLESEFSMEYRRRSRSLVSCARNAADDEGLRCSSRSHRVQPEQGCHI